MVDPGSSIGLDVARYSVSGSGETMEVLEGEWAVAEGEERWPGGDEVYSGVEDERGELRSIEGTSKFEEDEELQRRDQMEASCLVFSVSDNHLSCLLYRFGDPCLQIHPLLVEKKNRLFGSWDDALYLFESVVRRKPKVII